MSGRGSFYQVSDARGRHQEPRHVHNPPQLPVPDEPLDRVDSAAKLDRGLFFGHGRRQYRPVVDLDDDVRTAGGRGGYGVAEQGAGGHGVTAARPRCAA